MESQFSAKHEKRLTFAQMCCAMSLVCPSIATHRTCQFWAHSEPVNMPKTIESPTRCGVHAVILFLYSEQATRNVVFRYCPFHDNAIKRLLKSFRWEHGRLARWRKWKSCDVGEAKEGWKNDMWRRWSNGSWRMSCDVDELCSFSNISVASSTSQVILQLFRCFTYVTAHYPSLLSLHLCHKHFTNVSWRAVHGFKLVP